MLNGEATHTNFKSLVWSERDPESTIYLTRGEPLRHRCGCAFAMCFMYILILLLMSVVKAHRSLYFLFIHLPTINKALNLNMTSFIGYINNTVLKFPIYFNSNMVLFTSFLSEFTYSYKTEVHSSKNARIVSLHLSAFTFVICRLPMT